MPHLEHDAKLLSPKAKLSRGRLALFGGLTAAVGVVVVVAIFAATGSLAIEAESGTLSGPAVVATVAGASGGKAVQFGSGATPTPTSTPVSGGKNCYNNPSSCGYPDATNTGVLAGTTLTASGSITISTAGQVVQDKNITGCVNITASNVTFKNSVVHATSGCVAAVATSWDGVSGVKIDHVEIDGGKKTDGDNHSMAGLIGSGYTATYMNVHDTGDGMDVGSNNVIQNSFIHGLWVDGNAGGPPHVDGIQSAGGDNYTITHNTIDDSAGNDSAIIFGADLGTITTAVVSDNIMAAPSGQPVLRAGHNSGSSYQAKGVQFLNNRMVGTNNYSFLPDGTNPLIFTGNIRDSDNSAIPNFNNAGNGSQQYYG